MGGCEGAVGGGCGYGLGFGGGFLVRDLKGCLREGDDGVAFRNEKKDEE